MRQACSSLRRSLLECGSPSSSCPGIVAPKAIRACSSAPAKETLPRQQRSVFADDPADELFSILGGADGPASSLLGTTPPSRSHNPLIQDYRFSNSNAAVCQIVLPLPVVTSSQPRFQQARSFPGRVCSV